MAAIHGVIIVKRELLHMVKNIQTDIIAVGFGNTLPNKGAVSISFELCGKKLLFINCHLSAHMHRRAKRAREWKQIKQALVDGVS